MTLEKAFIGPLLPLAVFLVITLSAGAQDRSIVIRSGNVLDGRGGILENTSIVVEGSRIARVDAEMRDITCDLRDLTVMPGWIDTHVHLSSHINRDGRAHPPEIDAASCGEAPEQSILHAVENVYRTLATHEVWSARSRPGFTRKEYKNPIRTPEHLTAEGRRQPGSPSRGW